jgi:hypothetical protein
MAPDKRMWTGDCQDSGPAAASGALTLSHSPLEPGANP